MVTFRIFWPSRRPPLEKISPVRPVRFSVVDNISMHRFDSGTASGLSSPFFPLRRGPGMVHTLALKSISDQSASNVSLVLVAVRISHSSGSEPIPSCCRSSLTNPWICSYRRAFWCCTASVCLPSNSFIGPSVAVKDFPCNGIINDGLDSHPNTPRGLGFVVPDGLQYPDDHVTIDGLYWQVTNDGMYVGRQCVFPLLTVLCAFPRNPVGGQIIVGRLPERQLADAPDFGRLPLVQRVNGPAGFGLLMDPAPVLTGEFARFFEGEVAEAAQPHLAGLADNHIAVDPTAAVRSDIEP